MKKILQLLFTAALAVFGVTQLPDSIRAEEPMPVVCLEAEDCQILMGRVLKGVQAVPGARIIQDESHAVVIALPSAIDAIEAQSPLEIDWHWQETKVTPAENGVKIEYDYINGCRHERLVTVDTSVRLGSCL